MGFYSPLGHILRQATGGGVGIEDLAELAAVPPRCLAVDADIEVLAVMRVGVAGVGHGLLHLHARTREILRLWKG